MGIALGEIAMITRSTTRMDFNETSRISPALFSRGTPLIPPRMNSLFGDESALQPDGNETTRPRTLPKDLNDWLDGETLELLVCEAADVFYSPDESSEDSPRNQDGKRKIKALTYCFARGMLELDQIAGAGPSDLFFQTLVRGLHLNWQKLRSFAAQHRVILKLSLEYILRTSWELKAGMTIVRSDFRTHFMTLFAGEAQSRIQTALQMERAIQT